MMLLGRCVVVLTLAACTTHHHTTVIEIAAPAQRPCSITSVDDRELRRPPEDFVDTPTGPVTASGSPIAVDLDDRPPRRTPPPMTVDPDDDFPRLKPFPLP